MTDEPGACVSGTRSSEPVLLGKRPRPGKRATAQTDSSLGQTLKQKEQQQQEQQEQQQQQLQQYTVLPRATAHRNQWNEICSGT
ncbi:hypothetical protein AWZ03_001577 [Drosophila navojoa]|uniref:Uncharacterized protein n=1 Tax=Drosophila navojoa TaxID=7232 RepID=A0A484BSZ6_DRONA|nr:hypothetical protein AWZ03_001577 [Drosophila navojoa]